MTVPMTARDLALLFVAGVLTGLLLTGRGKDRRNKPIARLLGLVLEPIYWWADLYGHDNRPSHSKVTYAVTLAVMLAATVTLGVREAETGGLSFQYVIFAIATMAYGLGRSAYNAFLHSALGEKLVSIVTQQRASAGNPRPPGMEDG